MTIKKTLLITISAVGMSLSFHPIGLHFLAWISLIPILLVISDQSLSQTFIAGITFGTLFSLFSLFWLVFLQIDMDIKILMYFGLLLMFLYIGLYYGVSLLIAKKIGLWFLPLSICALEYIRGIGELGFPWLLFGYSQARYPLVIQQASIYGIYGLSAWVVLVNVVLFYTIKLRRLKMLLLAILIFGIPLGFGYLRLNGSIQSNLGIGVIQPNIDPNQKFTRAMRKEAVKRLFHLSRSCAQDYVRTFDQQLDLIVWPETAIPFFLQFSEHNRAQLFDFVDSIDIPVLTGAHIYKPKQKIMHNAAVLIEPGKGVVQEYHKIHLVPFGEHIPFDQSIPALKSIDVGGGHLTPGKEYTVFALNDSRFACLICFESIFPELSRQFILNNANLLLNITNDGWFGKIAGSQQHNDMAIIRTVEHNVPLARSANTGISMIVNCRGQVLHETKLFVQGYAFQKVSTGKRKTLFTLFGNIIPQIALVIIPLILLGHFIKIPFIHKSHSNIDK